MKIAILQRFLPSRSRGGVGHFTHGLANALQQNGHQVTVFSQDPAPEAALYQVLQIAKENRAVSDILFFPFKIARQDFSSFDIIHAQGDDSFLPKSGVPVVRTLHGSALAEAFYNGLCRFSIKHFLMHSFFYILELISCLRADELAGDSEDTKRYYPRKPVFIPNGVDRNLFSAAGQKSAQPSIFFVGEINTRKRGRLLVEVFQREIRPKLPGAELWLVCPEKVEGAGIRWFGQVSASRLAELYQTAWVFCLPSSYEGFGRPYIEAMASGTPVVASPNPGAREVLGHGEFGCITSDGMLGENLYRFLTRADLREKFRRLGMERVPFYSWDRIVLQYETLYEKALQKKGRSRKPAVLYLQATSEIGGADMTLLRTVQALDKTKFEPHVLFPEPGPLKADFEKAGCRIYYIPAMRKLTSRKGPVYLLQFLLGYLPAVAQIAKMINREKIDLVHTNTVHNFYGFLAARITGRPHVWHVREIVVQSGWARRLEQFLVPRFSNRFIVMSDAIFEMFRLKDGTFPQNGVKLYDGLDLQCFNPSVSGQRVRRELGVESGISLVGTVCRLDPWKGIGLFLEAAGEVLKQMPEVRFLVCGGEIRGHEGYESKLKQKAKDLGILDKVFFTGWKYSGADIPEVYAALKISVQCPVYPEPYGLAALEAMASGVPVIAPAEGGPAELCVPDETAFLFPPRDAQKLAQAILRLLQDPQKAKAMGNAGRKRAETFFDMRQCTAQLEKIYEKILTGEREYAAALRP